MQKLLEWDQTPLPGSDLRKGETWEMKQVGPIKRNGKTDDAREFQGLAVEEYIPTVNVGCDWVFW